MSIYVKFEVSNKDHVIEKRSHIYILRSTPIKIDTCTCIPKPLQLSVPAGTDTSHRRKRIYSPYFHSFLSSALSIAFFIVFSNIFLASQNPCFVLPNEFGPADVGVSLKQNKMHFFVLLLLPKQFATF